MKRILTLCLALSAAGAISLVADGVPPSKGDSSPLLDEIARLTQGGFSGETVLGFVKARRADIPSILTVEDLQRLRRSGVAETVIGYLQANTAIELNTTGRTAAMDAEPPKEPAYVQQPVYVVPPYPYGFFFRRHPPPPPPPRSAPPGFPRIGANGFPILAPPDAPGGTPPPIGPNGFPVLGSVSGSP